MNTYDRLVMMIEKLDRELTAEREIIGRYRKALEEIVNLDTLTEDVTKVFLIARTALSSPTPEPVTVEELNKVIMEVCDSEANVADYLHTTFDIRRKP